MVVFSGGALYLAWFSLCTAKSESRQRLLGLLGDDHRSCPGCMVQAARDRDIVRRDFWFLSFSYREAGTDASST